MRHHLGLAARGPLGCTFRVEGVDSRSGGHVNNWRTNPSPGGNRWRNVGGLHSTRRADFLLLAKVQSRRAGPCLDVRRACPGRPSRSGVLRAALVISAASALAAGPFKTVAAPAPIAASEALQQALTFTPAPGDDGGQVVESASDWTTKKAPVQPCLESRASSPVPGTRAAVTCS
jgi:hypothetical protein